MAKNNMSVSQSKNTNIKYLAIKECIKNKKVFIQYINTKQMSADPSTKSMPSQKFKDHVVAMGLGSIIC